MHANIAESEATLLAAIPDDAMLVQLAGNAGDRLIDEGTRQMLARAGREVYTVQHFGPCAGESWCPTRDYRGTLVIAGGGAWCENFHDPVTIAEHARASRIVVLPSTFDTRYTPAAGMLSEPSVRAFARERGSQARTPGAELALCPSFSFDYAPWTWTGRGVLNAFRTDAESAGAPLPPDNVDLSLALPRLDRWLAMLAGCEEVRTDRAHVMVAAAMLGKRVRWREGSYWKVAAMAAMLPPWTDVAPL